jgi:HK97 family phage portal protein
MNIFEKFAHQAGRIRGQFEQGLDSVKAWQSPSLSDASAWIDPAVWGQAIAEGRKPQTKRDFIEAFTSWVYICVKLNAQAVASVPTKLYVTKQTKGTKYSLIKTRPISKQRMKWLYSKESLDKWLTKAEEIEEVTEHPLLDLLQNVNPWNNRRDLWESTIMFLDLTGEAYWYLPSLSIKGSKIPQQIWVIPAQYVTPKFTGSLTDPVEHYVYNRGGKETIISKDETICFTYPNPNNPFTGFSTIKAIADAVYIQRQMNEFEISLFENKARPGGILVPKAKMSKADRERMTEQFKQKYAGAKKAGKTLIPPADMEFIRDAMTPEEISYIEGHKLIRTEIMAAFDIPEGAIITETSSRAVADVADYRHAKYGVLPRIKRIEEKINERLVPRYDEKLFFAFDDPVPANREFEHLQRVDNVKASIITRDEARAEIGKDEMGEGAAQLWENAMNMPISGGGQEGQLAGKVIKRLKEILG